MDTTDLFFFNENSQTFRNVIEQLFARSQHNMLWNGEDFGLHLEVFSAEFDEQYPEVGASQIEGQELASL